MAKEQLYKVNDKKKPDEDVTLRRWYDRLQAKFGEQSFTAEQAKEHFYRYTCSRYSRLYFESLVSSKFVTKSKN